MIADYRAAVAAHMSGQPDLVDLPVHSFLPDDVNEVPCLVVGRPSYYPGREAGVDNLDVPLYVVGRRLHDEEAQVELDQWTDLVLVHAMQRIPGPPQVSTAVRASPETVQVAGSDFPAYVVTLTLAAPTPCGA